MLIILIKIKTYFNLPSAIHFPDPAGNNHFQSLSILYYVFLA